MRKTRQVHGAIFVILLFLSTAQGWAQDWVFYASTSTRDVYYDQNSVQKMILNSRRVWAKATLNEEGKKETFSYLKRMGREADAPDMLSHVLGWHEIDCANQKIKDLSTMVYDVQGHVLHASTKGERDQWNDILPASVGDLLKDIVCGEPAGPEAAVVAEFSLSAVHADHGSSGAVETIHDPEAVVRNRINQWLDSWTSGDWKVYRSCYAPDFQSKGMTLDGWVSHKTKVHRKSKMIRIAIHPLEIAVKGNHATAVFTQYYSSSLLKERGRKKLELQNINGEWKIVKEMM